MKVIAIAANSLRRLLRDRTNIFFVFLMPLLLILVLGAAFGGSSEPRVGLVAAGTGAISSALGQRIEAVEGIQIERYDSREALVLAVERGRLSAGIVMPERLEESLRAGRQAEVEFVARPDASAEALRNTLDAAVTEEGSIVRAAVFASRRSGIDFDQALENAQEAEAETSGIFVAQRTVGEPFAFDRLGKFELGAYSQLLLFIFITSTTGSTALIQSRQLGVSKRMLSTPTSVTTILGGEMLGRFTVAVFQGLIIIVGTALMFGVDWGDPVGATAVFILFALGASGVGMLMGATLKNDQQAGGVGVVVALALGALGGAMVPLVIMKAFAPTLYRIAHITPHAWGIEAFEQLIIYDKTVVDIVPQLAVLAGFAAVMVALGVWRLRVTLTRE